MSESNKEGRRRKYTEEYKAEAVALVTDHGYSAVEAARSLGINPNLIYKWRQAQDAGPRVDEDERAELKRLRREIKRLRMEKEILKKASAYFAKHLS